MIGEVEMKLRPLNWEETLTLKVGEGEGASYGRKTVKVFFLKVLNEGQEIVPGNIHRFERQFETFHAFHTRAG